MVTYGLSAQADLRITHSSTGHMASEFHLEFRGSGSGLLPPACSRRAQRAECDGGGGRGTGAGDSGGNDSRGAGRLSAGSTGDFRCAASERGVTVIDDYGHHPTEIRATLAAARACRYARIHVLFQPHRYTRTEALMDDFARAFHQADSVHVMDIYAASEAPIEGVTAEALAERMRAFGHRGAHYVGRWSAESNRWWTQRRRATRSSRWAREAFRRRVKEFCGD